MLRFSLPDSPPSAVGESCVHHQFRRASCRACVRACPVEALAITPQRVSLAADKCLGCGNCLYVCPTGALENLLPPQRYFRDHRLISPLSVTPPTLNELLLWHAQYHIRGVEMALDEHPRWGMAIAALNLTLQKLDEPRWQIFPSSEAVINTSRRRLLSVRSDPKTTATVQPAPLAAAFPGFTTFTPRLDPARCILCGACSRVCRQQALIQKEDAFHIHSQVCNGCEACHAVCPTDAINVVCAVVKAGEISYPLQQARCQSCQRGFSSWDEDTLQCPICRQHHYGMR